MTYEQDQMTISFYDASVASYLQVLTATAGFLDKAHTHLVAKGHDLEEVVETRLYPDMQPFRFQVQSVAHHSRGALDALRDGTFTPPPAIPPLNYVELLGLVTGARDALGAATRDEVDAFAGREVVFDGGEYQLRFTASNFVTSFSLPNFYFHVATAYDILRMKGVPLEKRNYLGRLRFEKTRKPT